MTKIELGNATLDYRVDSYVKTSSTSKGEALAGEHWWWWRTGGDRELWVERRRDCEMSHLKIILPVLASVNLSFLVRVM